MLAHAWFMHGSVTHSSYTIGTHGLPDIYTLSPWALGVYIRQITCAYGITIKCSYVAMFEEVQY